jgi:hypothetical protein
MARAHGLVWGMFLAACSDSKTEVEVEGPQGSTDVNHAFFGVTLFEPGPGFPPGDPQRWLHVALGGPQTCGGNEPTKLLFGLPDPVVLGSMAIDSDQGTLDGARVAPVGTVVMSEVTITGLPESRADRPFAVAGSVIGTIDARLRRVVSETVNGIYHYEITDETVATISGSFEAIHCPAMDSILSED